VKTFIKAVKNDDVNIISELMDFERILVQVKKESYTGMGDDEKKVEVARLRESVLNALRTGDLSLIKDINPVVSRSEIVDEGFGPKAVVVVRDKSGTGPEFVFIMSGSDRGWKIFSILREPA